MQGVAAWRYGIVVAHHERPLGDLGQALAAPARGKRRRQDGVLKINRDRVVHDPAQTGVIRQPPSPQF